MNSPHKRIDFLDGLRGLAILMVVVWHGYGSTYADHLPFQDRYSVLPINKFWVGVELFFLISGFVITMTLEKCDSIAIFGVRRWLRLFPAMFITSLLILAYDLVVGVGPHAQRSIANLVPGLLFISPSMIHTITGLSIESMDAPFWSLYVEVIFYISFAILYFRYGSLVAIAVIFFLSVFACLMGYMAGIGFGGNTFARVASLLDWLGIVHFGWFASGAFFYEYFRTKRSSFFLIAVTIGLVAALDWKPTFFSIVDRSALLLVVALFSLTVWSAQAQRILSTRYLVLAGFISYPLYLVHSNIVVGLTQLLGQAALNMPPWLYPIPPILLVFLIALVTAKYVEPITRRSLVSGIAIILARLFHGEVKNVKNS